MVGEPSVSPRGPSRKTFCPAVPSLQWVPGSRFPPFSGTLRREDYPLPISGRFACRSLPDTAPASRRSWSPSRAHGLVEAPRSRQGRWSPGPPIRDVGTETGGSPTFPSYPSADMPRSQTPVVSWALAAIAHRIVAFRRMQTVGFCLDTPETILLTTTLHISGLNDAACLLAPASFVRSLLSWHVEFAPDRLARLWAGGT
jgi:hypothetical protein